MKPRILASDIVVLAVVVGLLILVLVDRGVWFDRVIGAGLVCTGLLIRCGVFPRQRQGGQIGWIPYPILGAFMILEGIALGVFHVRL